MTENDIVLTIIRERHVPHTCMPRYTPNDWFEADVWELTKSLFAVEYEIKLTRHDFKKDALKQDDLMKHTWRNNGDIHIGPHLSKHVRLQMGDPKGPSQFYFVTPWGLITAAEVPHWAGWATVSLRDKYWKPPYHLSLHIEKRAPRLHKEKVDEKAVRALHKCGYYRFHSAIWDLEKALNKNRDEEPPPVHVPFAEEEIDSPKNT